MHLLHRWELVGTVHDGRQYSDIPELCNPYYNLYECRICGKRKRVVQTNWLNHDRDVPDMVIKQSLEWVRSEKIRGKPKRGQLLLEDLRNVTDFMKLK